MEIFTVIRMEIDHYDETPPTRTIFKNNNSAINYILNELEKIRDECQCDGCGEYADVYYHCSHDCDYDLCGPCYTIKELREHQHIPITDEYPPPLTYYEERLRRTGNCFKEGVSFKIIKEIVNDDVKQSTDNWFKVKVDVD
jgi:hypothetical protein